MAVKVDGCIEWDVSVEKSLSAHGYQVAAHCEEHVGKQEGDGGRRAARHEHAHHGGLWDAAGVSL